MTAPLFLAVARLAGPRRPAAPGEAHPADRSAAVDRGAAETAWHAELAPGRWVAALFEPGSPLGHGLSRQSRQALRESARDVAGAPLTAREREDLLAFIANSEAVLGDGRTTHGMASPRACWLMACALERAAVEVAHTPAERAAMVDLMRTYRAFFASSLVNAHFRTRPEGRAEHAAVQPHLIAAALSPSRAGVLHSGYLGHTTLTRLAVVPPGGAGEVPAGSRLALYRERAAAALGPAGRALAGSYQLGLRPEDLRRPAIQALISPSHALVHPAGQPGMVNITRRLASGATRTKTLPAAEALPYLAEHNLLPAGNGIKATIHNGGGGARFGAHGDTRSYDQRLLIPVCEAEAALTPLLGAKLDDRDVARVAMDKASVYDAEAYMSIARSPAMAGQTLGNCTIHSQKLCMLYHLQHMREAGDGQALSAAGGAALFARLWTRVFAMVLRDCQDPQVRRRGKRAAAQLDEQMAAMLAGGRPTAGPAVPAARPAAAPPTPARSERRPPAPRDDGLSVIASVLAAPERPLPPRPHTPAALASFGASPAGPPPAALVAWMHGIAGSAWTPASLDEAVGFTRLRDHLIGQAASREERRALTYPIAGRATFARGRAAAGAFLDAPGAQHPALAELRDALFVWQFDADLIQQATPRELVRAWQAAAATDPLTQHLLPDIYRARPAGGSPGVS